MLLRTRKTTNQKSLNLSHRRTRFESLESRLCLSGCSISGTVYDARFAAGSEPLAGVQVFLDTDTDGVWDSGEAWTISDGNGEYSFQGLQPGSYPAEYTVAQTVPEGYTLTTPALGYHTVTFNQRRREVVWSRFENVVPPEATPYLFPPSRGRRVGSQIEGSRLGAFPGRSFLQVVF